MTGSHPLGIFPCDLQFLKLLEVLFTFVKFSIILEQHTSVVNHLLSLISDACAVAISLYLFQEMIAYTSVLSSMIPDIAHQCFDISSVACDL